MAVSELDERELGELLAAGDERAMALILDQFQARLQALATRLLGDPHLAEDVVQECLISVWLNARSFDPSRGSLRSWLYTCLRNRATDALRRRRPVDPLESHAELVSDYDPAADGELSLLRGALRTALAGLPPDQRFAVSRAYIWGQSASVIADGIGGRASTVKGRLRLARAKLKVSLAGLAEPAPGIAAA